MIFIPNNKHFKHQYASQHTPQEINQQNPQHFQQYSAHNNSSHNTRCYETLTKFFITLSAISLITGIALLVYGCVQKIDSSIIAGGVLTGCGVIFVVAAIISFLKATTVTSLHKQPNQAIEHRVSRQHSQSHQQQQNSHRQVDNQNYNNEVVLFSVNS